MKTPYQQKIKKSDLVLVLKGKDRGKSGVVEKMFPRERKAVVGQINLVKKHIKPSKNNPTGGIVSKPAPVYLSNLAIICSNCKKAVKVGFKVSQGTKSRICRKCQEIV